MLLEGSREDYGGRLRHPGQVMGRLEPVHARHPDVEEHDFRAEPTGEQQCFLAARCDACKLDGWQLLDEVRQPLACKRLVIDDQYAKIHLGLLPAGKRSVTTKRSGASITSTSASPWNMSSSRWRTLSSPMR